MRSLYPWEKFGKPFSSLTQSYNCATLSRTRDFPVLDMQRHIPNRQGMPQYSPHAAMLWESRVDAQSCKNNNYSDISGKDKAHFWIFLNLFSWRCVCLKSGLVLSALHVLNSCTFNKPLYRQEWSPSLQFAWNYTADSCSLLWLYECLKIWEGNTKLVSGSIHNWSSPNWGD